MNNPKKNIGFKIPMGYFKTLEEKILNDVKEGANLQNNFFVPYNYFNNLKLDFLDKRKSLRFKKNIVILGSGFSFILIILLFMIFNQKEIIKIDDYYTDIESELRINPLKAYEISRSIEKVNYKSFNSNFSNFQSNQIDPNQIYFNNSFNIYYEESDY